MSLIDNVAAGEHDEEEGSQGASSRQGSITHPYRSLLKNTSFPRCHLIYTPPGRVESFVRSIFPLGNGFPLWDPIGNQTASQRLLKETLSIGDVGIVTSAGDFRYYFNIFLPANDPSQIQCPQDHEPLLPAPAPSEIILNPNHFPAGTVLLSKGVSVSRTSESPLDLSFTTQAREAGMVVFPDGASREDLASTSRLFPYVRKHALDWYRFINKKLVADRQPNGTLYLVTGCDRAKSWGFASCPQFQRCIGKKGSVRYKQGSGQPWQDNNTFLTTWDLDGEPHGENCAIFIRGMRIAVNNVSWTKDILENQPPRFVPHFNLLSTPLLGIQARAFTLIERWRNYPRSFQSVITMVMFHPVSIVCRILLDEVPTAAVAIAEDSLWSSVSEKDTDGTLPEVIKQLTRILETHEINESEGLVTFVLKAVPSEVPAAARAPFFIRPWLWNIFTTRRQQKNIRQKIAKALPGPDYKEKPVPS